MSSDPELNDRQRRFIEAVTRGLSAAEAARSAGYSHAYAKKAGRLLKSPVIAKAVATIREQARSVAVYGLVEAMREADSAAAFARAHKNPMALVKATELRAKLSGLLIDRLEVVPPVDLRNALEEARHRVIDITPRPRADSATTILTESQPPVGDQAVRIEVNGSPKWKPLMD